MKTTINKSAIATTIKNARALEEQARKIRLEARAMKVQIKEEEEAILLNMVQTVESATVFMSAREIVDAIGGTMSVHEVAGQLTYARNSKDAQRKPLPYAGPHNFDKGFTMAHKTMRDAAPAVEVESRRVTRRFAEVDSTGKIIPGGKTFKQQELKNVYAIKR